MFKNCTAYRIDERSTINAEAMVRAMESARFAPCEPTQATSVGWVEPRGIANASLIESINGHIIVRIKTESRQVPGSVVKKRAEEIADELEKQEGRRPGKKRMKEVKEQALLELMPAAFTKESTTFVCISPAMRMILIDTASQSRADSVATMLIKACEGLSLSLINTTTSPAVAMAHWLGTGEPPYQFSVDRECELKSPDEMKSVVRYTRHNLDMDEVKGHILAGKVPTRLAMTWRDRLSFTLDTAGKVKKLEFLDVVFEGKSNRSIDKNEAFDADVAIFTGEIAQMLPDLIDALGGEFKPQEQEAQA